MKGPKRQPMPRNMKTIPFAFVNLSSPTMSTKYSVVSEFKPAWNISFFAN